MSRTRDEGPTGEPESALPLGRLLLLMSRSFEHDLLAGARERGFSDITLADLQVLHFVQAGGSTSTEISRLAGISKQAVGKAVASLEGRGYLTRRPCRSDRRAVVVDFTKEGLELLGAGVQIVRRIEAGYRRSLGKENCAALKTHLGLLVRTFPVKARGLGVGDRA